MRPRTQTQFYVRLIEQLTNVETARKCTATYARGFSAGWLEGAHAARSGRLPSTLTEGPSTAWQAPETESLRGLLMRLIEHRPVDETLLRSEHAPAVFGVVAMRSALRRLQEEGRRDGQAHYVTDLLTSHLAQSGQDPSVFLNTASGKRLQSLLGLALDDEAVRVRPSLAPTYQLYARTTVDA